MKRFMIGRLACLTVAAVLTVGQPAFAFEQTVVRSTDVALADGGVLYGSVLTATAQPVSATTVTVLHGETQVAEAVTNANGEFAVKGLRNGAHTIRLANSSQPVRFWSGAAAPPGASERLVLVSSPNIVRAQEGAGFGDGAGALLLFGGVVAVVLVTTLDDDNDPPPSSP